MSPTATALKRQSLEAQRDIAARQYKALSEQLLVEVNPATRVQLQHAAEARLAELERIEQELAQLGAATPAPGQPIATSNSNPGTAASVPPEPKALRDALTANFNLSELRLLSEDLGVDFDNLDGSTKQIKALELVQYFQRRNRLPELAAKIRQERPGAGV
jgi:hypothetical protein